MASPLSPEEFRRETAVSRETLERLQVYAAVLARWNRAVNLVSRASLDDLWRRHMLDSAQLLPLLPAPATGVPVIADLGSGAGFPGMVLSLLGAGAVHLVESDRRKALFLQEVARETGSDAKVHNLRIEDLKGLPADVVTARACAPLPVLLGYAERFPPRSAGAPRWCLFLKGKRAHEELTEARKQWQIEAESFSSCSDPAGIILRIGLRGRETATS